MATDQMIKVKVSLIYDPYVKECLLGPGQTIQHFTERRPTFLLCEVLNSFNHLFRLARCCSVLLGAARCCSALLGAARAALPCLMGIKNVGWIIKWHMPSLQMALSYFNSLWRTA